ncbi:chromosome partitioning protein [Gemmobacter caeni]|uniref:CobQ/CobB/MinD/ParA family nucleotide binding protein n=1 Tax=Gemmobacter caeni TaxID=589035 RepID=A0A2T6A9E4_9RHOB|nr:AAA family ATPase [Gemmobacter caeni]PTX40399.1 CobQ/CobB/MinD/ParA family nucleotide binding protein [Gemmobacter caeni]TWI89914.1 chromosome partitioning protein [Gemmobacter caeni]
MEYGIRVVLVMNRKGGSGKSTLCRALASAAMARGETVTIFDTDSSKSCLNWMRAGQTANFMRQRSFIDRGRATETVRPE